MRQSTPGAFFLQDGAYHIHQSNARIKSYWRSFSIVKDLQAAGIDLYHGLSNELPHNLAATGIRSVVTIHDLIFKIYPRTYSLSERLIYDRKFRYACTHADKVVAISAHTRQDIIDLYGVAPEKIEVVYQSCNPLFYQSRSSAENEAVARTYGLPERYLLYVGSIEERKNLKLIIEAYHKAGSLLSVPVLVVGRGGRYKTGCQQLIAAYGLTDKFIWLDRLSNNEHLQSIYQMATALVYPSFYEGFGLPVAEALLSRIPVVTANTSSLTEAGGPHAFYINPECADELIDALVWILAEKSELAERVAKGYHYAQDKFNVHALTDQMMQLYRTLL